MDGKEAQKIFKRAGKHELLVRLNTARGVVYASLGRLHRALRLFNSTLSLAKTLGSVAQQHLVGMLNMDIGVAHDDLGNYSQALNYYEQAQSVFAAENETRNIALVELNIAYIAQAQSCYRYSLQLLHTLLERGVDRFPMEYLAIKRDMTECYLQLNRYAEARDLAQKVVDGYRTYGAAYETARSLMHLATAEAELGNFTAAHAALREAEDVFEALGAASWQAIVRLRRGRIALREGDITRSYREATSAAASFDSVGQLVNYAAAMLLQGQALFKQENLDLATQAGSQTLNISQRYNIPSLRYTSHLLLGKIAEAKDQNKRAMRRYQAAASAIERVQRGLTITLRPGFLEDKGEASRALTALYLRCGQATKAFETIENSKSQVLLGYILNRENLHWSRNTSSTRALIEELNRLRAEHQWFYRLAHEPPRNINHSNSIPPEQALIEVTTRERRMRAITEKLYLLNDNDQQVNHVPKASLSEIQRTLDPGDLLVEYYSDGIQLWAFVLDRGTIKVSQLSVAVETVNQLLSQLQTNVGAILGMTPHTPAYHSLTNLARLILRRLHALLFEPLSQGLHGLRRLVFVPYGPLHYLPFHLLYDGSGYLIEKHEVVILPAASLATRTIIPRSPGALILAHSYDGRLPDTLAEARMVKQLFGGNLYVNDSASRQTLQKAPTQILHIAAHGEHRLDQPDLSYLHLADGQLYADDLLQEDLSYELVTLSGCETGRANVAASDELIGLGRGVLYAGAGALVVSQWRIADDSTLEFMRRMYKALRHDKKSKAAAIREAQQSLFDENRQAHPATWGSFRLIGNAEPLSSVSS